MMYHLNFTSLNTFNLSHSMIEILHCVFNVKYNLHPSSSVPVAVLEDNIHTRSVKLIQRLIVRNGSLKYKQPWTLKKHIIFKRSNNGWVCNDEGSSQYSYSVCQTDTIINSNNWSDTKINSNNWSSQYLILQWVICDKCKTGWFDVKFAHLQINVKQKGRYIQLPIVNHNR